MDSLAEVFAHLLSSLNHHIAIKPVTPETVAENCFASGKEEKETPGRPRFNIPAEMLEELRELGFSWIKSRRIWFAKHNRISSFARRGTR